MALDEERQEAHLIFRINSEQREVRKGGRHGEIYLDQGYTESGMTEATPGWEWSSRPLDPGPQSCEKSGT